MSIHAKMIHDSVSPGGIRLSTVQLRIPKMLLGQVKTHRIIRIDDTEYCVAEDISINQDPNLSRNAASSRAIPTKKLIDRVKDDPVIPIFWGKNRPGMQATEELEEPNKESAEYLWKRGVYNSICVAEEMHRFGLHKQIVNRVLEPYMYADVIVTATEWDNFFNLRLDDAAQPEMQRVAQCIKKAMDNSTPKTLEYGQWHLPYVSPRQQNVYDLYTNIKCSVARVARVSYVNHDQSFPDIDKDINTHDKLFKDRHPSPFEHIATPIESHIVFDRTYATLFDLNKEWPKGITHIDRHKNLWSGNLKGWCQYRQLIF